MSEDTLPILLGAGTAGGLLWYATRRDAHARPLESEGLGAAAEPPSPLPGRWVWPVEVFQGRRSVITNPWGARPERLHKGVDIMFPRMPGDIEPDTARRGHPRFVVPPGARALAASDGVVWSASRMPRGFTIVIDHGNYATFYTHLSQLLVAPTARAASKQRVYAGQPIGTIGADPTDPEGLPHLHFELWRGGPSDAIDPGPLMRFWEHITPPPSSPSAAIITTPPEPASTPTPHAPSSAGLLLDLGRPVPASVRAIVGSGWASARGTGSTRRLHRALDFGLPIGTPILAVDQGVVTFVQSENLGDAGIWIAVRHPSGITSRYIHLSRALVKLGQTVQRGEQIGLSGDTGSPGVPHLHLDLRAPAEMLPAIEAAMGRPRSGWGPEMKPYGHSIPGEPFVSVDAYREIVRTDAVAMGIPLRDPSLPRNGVGVRNASLTYRPVGGRGEPYPAWVRALDGKSGVYIIRDLDADGRPEIVYVGSSSADRLYDTLTRHFQQWRRWKGFWKGAYGEGHDPGLTYERARVDVAVRITPASRALDEEARLIRRLRPRDNLNLIGHSNDEAVPF